MSDDFLEPTSDSFWEIGQYKRTVKRCEDGYKVCHDLQAMLADRADIEKAYAKSLKSWSKKWNDYLHKGSEYGTMKATWTAALNEADRIADIHQTTHNVLIDELNNDIKQWQKTNYVKSIVNTLKMAKEYEEEFKKAQKPWSKKYLLAEKTKKDYHSACKSFQSAKVQHNNSLADSAISPDQKKKLEDKVEKYKKEVEITKNKYKQALDDLNAYNSRYIEDMNTVYKKCDQFESQRIEFFIEKFLKLHSHLNLYERTNISDIYADLLRVIKASNPNTDLQTWSREYGNNMPMNWPVFEEYSEELKTIAKGSKASRIGKDHSDNNGVTMTSIRHKTEDGNDSNIDARSISNTGNDSANRSSTDQKRMSNYQNNSASDSKESNSNPFGEFDDEEEANSNNAAVNHSQPNGNSYQTSQQNVNELSDDDSESKASAPSDQGTYLNVRVKALYDYNSAEDDELSFKAGEEFIKLAAEDDRGWCLGKLGNKIGLYPATYAVEN